MKNFFKKMSFLLVVMLAAAMTFGCGTKTEETQDTKASEVVSEAASEAATETASESEAVSETAAETENADLLDVSIPADAELEKIGEGAKEFRLAVIGADKNVAYYDVFTNEANVGAALFALEVINDASFFTTVNGVEASWDKDQAYWAVYTAGEYAQVGVGDMALGEENPDLAFVYTVGF